MRPASLFRQHSQHTPVNCSLMVPARAATYRDIKSGYQQEPYIANTSRPLRRIMAQFRTGSHWLNIETGRYHGEEVEDRTCTICDFKIVNPDCPTLMPLTRMMSAQIQSRTNIMQVFVCSRYRFAQEAFPDLFSAGILTVGQFLRQPDCKRVAQFLSEIKFVRSRLCPV